MAIKSLIDVQLTINITLKNNTKITKLAVLLFDLYDTKKVKPSIISHVTNLGPIPTNALITADGEPFLVNKEYFLVDINTPGLTPQGTSDHLVYDLYKCKSIIF